MRVNGRTNMAGGEASAGAHVPRPMSLTRLILLHLFPGALATALFVVTAQPFQDAGYPPVMGLMLGIVVVIVPWELGVVLLAGRGSAQGGALAAIPIQHRLTAREWLVFVPALLVVAVLGFGLLSLLETPIRDAAFGWLPDWYREIISIDSVSDYANSAWIVTLSVYAMLNVFVGPAVEELYFRGYLMPRMSQMGKWAPFVNVVLFSLYHFWAPWGFLSRIAGVTPFAYAVWWKRNVYLGMAVHILLNGIGTASLIAMVAGKLS